jgi:hypothetical protein
MTVQFLPWVRRGLAAQLGNVDAGAGLPARAAFSVSVAVNGQQAGVDIETYGPGDVTGVDPLAISRVAPKRDATNVAPDEFAVVEFDEPDLPWMFTPASAGTDHRLRPWLVLVVVRQQPGVSIGVDQTKPLPVLTIDDPAVPADELPDLSQSWAWAHAQVVTATTGDPAVAALSGSPGQSLARLMCPRRLEPNTPYLAALVPAFDLGVAAGLGQEHTGTEVSPAWDRAALGASIQLPVYYQWDFSTGPPGDFESLARELKPMFVPGGIGETPMFVGDAHPALPRVAPDAGGIVAMQGALRAPNTGTGNLSSSLDAWVQKLTATVDATAAAASDGSSANAEAVAPPIYGEWHVNVHKVPTAGNRPRWLRDLNADPRHRAGAGIGADVVRANQEEYVDAAWKQVGDVLAANRLLEAARGLAAIASRVHERHVVGIDAVRGLAFADRARMRLPFADASLGVAIDRSATLPGFLNRNFRRIASPRSIALRQATRRLTNLSGTLGADVASLRAVPQGELRAIISELPDGVRATTITALADKIAKAGGPNIDSKLVDQLRAAVTKAGEGLDGAIKPVTLRPDLAKVGVVTDLHLDPIRATASLADDLVGRIDRLRVDIGATDAGQVIGVIVATGGFAPVTLTADGSVFVKAGGHTVDVTPHVAGGIVGKVPTPTLPTRFPTGTIGRIRPGLPTGPAAAAPSRVERSRTLPAGRGAVEPAAAPISTVGPVLPVVAEAAARLREPEVALAGLHAVITDATFDARILGEVATVIGLQPAGGDLTTASPVVVPVPTADRAAFEVFVDAFNTRATHLEEFLAAVPPEVVPAPLDVDRALDAIVRETRPRPMIEARIDQRLRIGDQLLSAANWDGRISIFQEMPLAPVMVGPVLERPLYLDLAAYDPDRFLPGAGDIPENAITLVETNPRFVEAFLVGANHELNRELLWRRYPTDRRGTAFRKFWDRLDDGDDIQPINEWVSNNRLGSNSAGDADGNVVLLVRGKLLRRYPNTVIYAAPSTTDRRIDPTAAPIAPIFAGYLDPDIAFVGFGFDANQAESGNGTIFVLQEQPAEPRFGFDVPAGALPAAPTAPPSNWSDLTWGQLAVAPGGFVDVTAFGGTPSRPLSGTAPTSSARFGADAAHMAAIAFQRPFRAAVHSSEILE